MAVFLGRGEGGKSLIIAPGRSVFFLVGPREEEGSAVEGELPSRVRDWA